MVPGGGTAELATAAATLAILVGAMLVLASLLRLGFVANFISDPVLAGFKSGIGLVIVVDQIPKLLGFHIEKTGFFRDILAMVQQLPQTSPTTLALALVILALLFGLERFMPRAPAPLIAVAVGIAASALFGLQHMGVETVGNIPRDLPSLVWPHLDLAAQMWPGALGIALMSFTESIAAARAFAKSEEPRRSRTRSCSRLAWPTLPAVSSAPCRPVAARHRQQSIAAPVHARSWPSSSLRPPRLRLCSFSRRSLRSCRMRC